MESSHKLLYTYALTSDSGFAPCISHNLFTLACCKGGKKGGMRKSIGEKVKDGYEIWVLGLCGKAIDANSNYKPIYLAKITGVTDMITYYSGKSKNRNDDVYYVDNSTLVPTNNNPHNEDQRQKDRNGKYVLYSNCFTYFGDNCNEYSDIEDCFPQIIEDISKAPRNYHVYNNIDDFFLKAESDWSWFKSGPNIIGKPHTETDFSIADDDESECLHNQKIHCRG